MNKLIIIGNGFDLAHGLETSYKDFILWYFKKALKQFPLYEDSLLLIKRIHEKIEDNPNHFDFKDYSEFIDFYSKNKIPQSDGNFYSINGKIKNLEKNINSNILINIKSDFLKKIIESTIQYNWVDIEKLYYEELLFVYKDILNQVDLKASNWHLDKLKTLNNQFNEIKIQLENYIHLVEILDNTSINKNIETSFIKITLDGVNQYDITQKFVFLNFNYTNTLINHYDGNISSLVQNEVISIHGNLNNKENPIIFGYGDEIDENYKRIQDLGNNDFLDYIKSFDYLKTSNYQNLLRFINSEKFKVYILGHSCGLSDRILLNTIFEHSNCQKIQIYYHERSEKEGDNDYREKSMEISRHFKDSAKMRERLVPLSECKPLVSFSKEPK